MKFSILGAGAFGTAFATLLANNNLSVRLWSQEDQVIEEINNQHTNKKYLPNIQLPSRMNATNKLAVAVSGSNYIIIAVPATAIRSVTLLLKKSIKPNQIVIVLSKGIENESFLLPTQIVEQILSHSKIAYISGPSFADQLTNKQLTGVTISSKDLAITYEISNLLTNSYFSTEISEDFLGVQLCGAFKNLIALASGISIGLNLTSNTQAYIATKGFQELKNLLMATGNCPETADKLCGIGDLILTATNSTSRNWQAGKLLAEGESLQTIVTLLSTVESFNTVLSLYNYSRKNRVHLPFTENLYNYIYREQPVNWLCL